MLVSIVIPTYNRAAYLPLALDSALGQTYPHLEVVVVDDGSTDGTLALLDRYARDHPGRLHYVLQANGGCASARNAGLREARGDVVAFLDSDDWFLPRKLELQVAALRREQADVVFGPWFVYDEPARRYRGPFYPVAYDHPEQFPRRHFLDPNFHFHCALVRRTCLPADGPFDETLLWNEDSDLAQRLSLAGGRWVTCPYPCFVVRAHAGGKSRDRVRIYEHLIRSAVRLGDRYPAFRAELGPAYEARLAELWRLLALAHDRQGSDGVSTCLAEAARLDPDPPISWRLWARLPRRLRWLLTSEGPPEIGSALRALLRETLGPSRVARLQRLRHRLRPEPVIAPEQVPGAPPADAAP